MTPQIETPSLRSKPKLGAKKKPSKKAPPPSKRLPTVAELQAQADAIVAKPAAPSSSSPPVSPEGFSSPLLRPLRNTSPFAKWAVVGAAFAPTFAVAVDAVVGIHKAIKSRRPIVVIDADDVAHFHIPTFEKAKIEALHMMSRSLADLGRVLDDVDAAGIADVVLIGNVTGYYDDLVDSYKQRNQVETLKVSDWTAIKSMWRREFSSKFRRLGAHAVFTGRLTDRYGTIFNDDGTAESVAVGTKLRAEKETAYDAHLFVEIEQVETETPFDDGEPLVETRARVLNDETGQLRRGSAVAPTFTSWVNTFTATLANAAPRAVFEEGSTAALFSPVSGHRQRQSLIGEIEAELSKLGNSRVEFVARRRAAALNGSFRTSVWSTIELLDTDELVEGLELLRQAMADGGATLFTGAGPSVAAAGAGAVDAVRAALADSYVDTIAATAGVDVVVARNRAVAAANSVTANLTEPHRSAAVDAIKGARKRWATGGPRP